MKNIHLKITGMGCGACVKKCETALSAVQGVKSVSVDLKGKCADVTCDDSVFADLLVAAVNGVGFSGSIE